MKKIINYLLINLLFGANYKNKIIKSHKILKQDTKRVEYLINNLKEEIENYLQTKREKNSSIYDLCLSQFIFKNLINNKYFNEKLILEICNLNKFYYPLPTEYLKIIKNKGFEVNFLLSKIMWISLIFIHSIYNLLSIITLLFFTPKNNLQEKDNTIIFLDAIPNINPNDIQNELPDFYNWFANFFLKEKSVNKSIIFVHNNKNIKDISIKCKNTFSYQIIYNKNFLLRNLKIYKYFVAVKRSLFLILKKDLKKILILKEIFFYKYVELEENCKPDYALFNMSNMTLKPLWSSIKNKNNDPIDYLYYYSTNIVPLVEKPETAPNVFGYRIQNWSNYIFWNEKHKNWIEKCSKRKINSIIVNNYIPFEGKNISIIKNEKKKNNYI